MFVLVLWSNIFKILFYTHKPNVMVYKEDLASSSKSSKLILEPKASVKDINGVPDWFYYHLWTLAFQLWGHFLMRLKTSWLIVTGSGKLLYSFLTNSYMQNKTKSFHRSKNKDRALGMNKQSRGTAWNAEICSTRCGEEGMNGWMSENIAETEWRHKKTWEGTQF